MISVGAFYNTLIQNNIDLFTGVPDSLLSDFCAFIRDNVAKEKNIITANEGNAIAIASGYNIASDKYGLVYMQNSGIGNAVNPLLSLADEEVYSIPMLLLIGWRGEPGIKDEPQHIKQGKVTIDLLNAMNIEYLIADENYEKQVEYCIKYMKINKKPIALIIKKGYFNKYKSVSNNTNKLKINREEALDTIIKNIGDSLIVSTTGKTSREIFEIRENHNMGHENDFLTVGSMGHTSSIALGMSLEISKNIYCIDGDGSFLMHMGGAAIAANYATNNFKYIIINNGAHESVGGQPTIAFDIDIVSILKGMGFENVYLSDNDKDIIENINLMNTSKKLSAMIINVNQGSRDDLGRPTLTPIQIKENLKIKIMKG